MDHITKPEGFPPGEYIREEIEARGWTQSDLADIMGWRPKDVNEIITGKRAITPETAKRLGDAFGNHAQFWMNLESAYRLSLTGAPDVGIVSRSKIYSMAPISDMQRRGWIQRTDAPDVLKAQILEFYDIKSLDDSIRFAHAARKSGKGDVKAQLAWLYYALHMAAAAPVTARFSAKALEIALVELAKIREHPEEIRRVPKVLSDAGIRFIIVEHLPHSRIDGACFWLDSRSPVVVLSMRFDRIDWFWHTLMHELGHVKNGDGVTEPTIDAELVGENAESSEGKPEIERKADLFAVTFLVDQTALNSFIARVDPLYSHIKIMNFAHKLRVHPGIVVGQLQHRGRITYAHSRRMLVRVRGLITPTTLTDGWGYMKSM